MIYLKQSVAEIPTIINKLGEGTVEKVFDSNGRSFGMGIVYNSRDNERTLLSLCSGNYMLIQNTEILNQIYSTFESSDKLIVREYNGTMTFTVVSSHDLRDGYAPTIIGRNSMNGRDKFSLQPGILKQVCTNGMMAGDRLVRKSVLHLISQKALLPEIYDEYSRQLLEFLDVYEKPELLKRYSPTKLEEFIKKLNKKRLSKFIQEYEPETVRDVYDSITDYASNKDKFNYELITAASSILYNPMILS